MKEEAGEGMPERKKKNGARDEARIDRWILTPLHGRRLI